MYKSAAAFILTVILASTLGWTLVSGQAPPPPPPALARRDAPPQVQPDPQMPPITFRSEVNYVEVDATVRDAQGRFVRDLRQDEVQIFENGKPQKVVTFSLVDMPVVRPERPLFSPVAIEPDVRSNVGGPDGRIYVIMLDDLHTSGMRSIQVRRAARQFIERNMGASDVAAVVHIGGRQDAGQEFTGNRRLLTDAVDKFMGRKLRSVTLEKLDQYQMQRGTLRADDPLKDPMEFERSYNARTTLETLRNVARLMTGVSGRRKAVLFFSEGIDYDITDFINNKDASTILADTQDAVAAATRANVQFYTVDPRGLSTLAEEGMELQAPPEDPSLGLDVRGLMNEVRLSQDSLRVLAEETGGFAAVNSNDFTTAFDRIVDENSTYYVMGYYPTDERRDGSFRKIDVRVSRPGVNVRARRGYVAPRGRASGPAREAKEGTSPVLVAALNSPLPVGGLALSVFAAPYKGTAPNAAVAIVVQTAPLTGVAFAQKDGKYNARLELSVMAIDPQGKVRGGKRETVDLSLRPETYQRVQQIGFRIQSSVEVPPGRYQFRVAVGEPGGRVGSVHYDLEIPDFVKTPLTMSGLSITAASAGIVPTAGQIPEIKGMLPAPPTVARVFSARDQLAVLAEVYDNQVQQSHSVDITARLRADDGRVVFSTEETRSSADLGGKPGGYGFTATVPLKDLAPGLYVLKVEAVSTLAGGRASREVQIRIVP